MLSHLFSGRSAALPNTETFSFAHDGRHLSVTMRRRSNAKRLTMRVRDGGLALTAPPHISCAEAQAFIRKHHHWIDQQLIAEEHALHAPNSADISAPAVWYLGALTQVVLNRDPSYQGRSFVTAYPDRLTITLAGGLENTSRLRPAAVLEDWLKKQAKADIQSSLDDVLPMLNQAPVPLTIRDQKTRWGSCSTTRRLSFNWRLIMAPPSSLHYVVVHEAAHLIHHDHSPRFWGLVEQMMPDFKPHQQWLRTHQQALFAGIDRRLVGLKPTPPIT